MYPEVEHGEPHKTGHKWVDLSVALCAIVVSAISLGVAIMHGQTMEKMADANARLVEANSWPFLQYTTGNTADNGDLQISMKVHNAGVGPAKLGSFEVFWQGKPVRNSVELLERCCGLDPSQLKTTEQLAKGATLEEKIAAVKKASQSGISSGVFGPGGYQVLEAHQDVTVLGLPLTPKTALVFEKLNAARLQVAFRTCYCSVFDECWTSDLISVKQTPVKACPKPAVPYGG